MAVGRIGRPTEVAGGIRGALPVGRSGRWSVMDVFEGLPDPEPDPVPPPEPDPDPDPDPPPPPPVPPAPEPFNQSFAVTGKQVYFNSGNQDNQSSTSPLFIQGTFDGTTGNRRFTLVFFNDSAIRSFLAGATITGVYFGTTRQGGSHGTPTATIRVGTTAASSPLGLWTGTGVTARGSASVGRGNFVEVPLTNATGTAFRDGSARSIALGSNTMSLALSEYGRYVSSGSYIRFVGTK